MEILMINNIGQINFNKILFDIRQLKNEFFFLHMKNIWKKMLKNRFIKVKMIMKKLFNYYLTIRYYLVIFI